MFWKGKNANRSKSVIPVFACDVFFSIGIAHLTIVIKTGKSTHQNPSFVHLLKKGVPSKRIKTN